MAMSSSPCPLTAGLSFAKVAENVPTTPTGSTARSGATPKAAAATVRTTQPLGRPALHFGGAGSVWVSYTTFPSTVMQALGARVMGLGQLDLVQRAGGVPTSDGRSDYGDTAVGRT